MGIGNSLLNNKTQARKESGTILSATLAIGTFSKHADDVKTRRQKLMDFLHEMRIRKAPELYPADDIGIKTQTDEIKLQEKESTHTYEKDVKDETTSPDMTCLCGHTIDAMFDKNAYPCRVCSQVYHRHCLIKCHECHRSGIKCLELARTTIGWSCYRCSDLIRLLTEEEVDKLTDKFEHCDLNNDGSIKLDEFIAYKSRLTEEVEGHHVTDDEKLYIRSRFRLMDLDGDKSLDWWEFLVQETKEELAKRNPEELVKLLTSKEISKVKKSFSAMDVLGLGKVDVTSLNNAGSSLYQSINAESVLGEDGYPKPYIMGCIREWNMTESGQVTWDEYLSGQAWSIICSRPNWFNPGCQT